MEPSISQYPSALCAACNGRGCATCGGAGKALYLGGRWVYWGRRLNAFSILERRTEQLVRGTIGILLLLIGIAGLAALTFVLRRAGVPDIAPWDAFAQERGDPLLFFFGLTLLTDLFLWYRLSRQSDVVNRIPLPPRGVPQPVRQDLMLRNVLALPHKERFELSAALTQPAYRALEESWQMARQFRAATLSAPFVFAALFSFSSIHLIQARLGMHTKKLYGMLQQLLNSLSVSDARDPEVGQEFFQLLFAAYRRALERRTRRIDVTELFGAAVEVSEPLQEVFDELETPPQSLENVVSWITTQDDLRHQYRYFRSRARFKPKGVMDRAMTAVATPYLDNVSTDLTALARAGHLPPCVARDRELDAIFRSLEDGHNVLLVGEPGVGKTAIIQGIAQRMVTEDVPKILQDKRLVSLSVSTLVGSQTAQIGVEERLNRALYEVARAGNIVLVIENVQHLVGVGSGGAATLDLSEILGAALASRRFLALASTNTTDFRRYVEPSAGLSASFSPLPVKEVDTNQAIKILEIAAGPLEYQHQVFFSYSAIARLVAIAERYIHDRYLPEKALSLMGEVAVYVRKARGSHAVVSAQDVAALVSEKINIPLTDVTEEESSKLLHLEERMHERLVGQDEAVKAVASALRRARVGLRDTKRPIANFLFLGPTGVGKTELAKTVARVYFGAEQNMIRLDMSEYQEQSSLNQLIGAPAGYSGGGTGGYLTDAVRRNPFSLVLLDELEKAHPDILNVFLQVMDDGRLTDSAGRTIDFTNVILIATSNAGTDTILQGMRDGQSLENIRQFLVDRELSRYFRPEFLNRFDQIVVFRPLTKGEIVEITKILLREVAAQLQEKSIALEASEAAIRELADEGFDPLFGARPLRRVIQEKVDNALARYLLTGKLGRRDKAILEPNGEIRVEEAPAIWQ